MDKLIAGLMVGVVVFGVMCIFAFLFAVVTQWAWAGSVAQVFHLPELTFSQAFWMNVLGGMLFKGSNTASSSK